MLIATAYHAERWPESAWSADAELMRQVGVNVVIMGEFAWCRLEPRRDRFHFDWFKKCVETMGRNQIKVVLSLPSLSPPPWLLERHPSILPHDEKFNTWWMGGTGHVCLNNAPYRKYVKRLVLELAGQFRQNPHVIGWMLNGGQSTRHGVKCYCDDCVQAFRAWLKRRYGTIGRLNELWGTCFWGQEFTDWHEIPAPRRAPEAPLPAMRLDWSRSVSDAAFAFILEQKDLLSRYSAKTQMTAVWNPAEPPAVDVGKFVEALDVVSFGTEAGEHGSFRLEPDIPRIGRPHWVVDLPAGSRQANGYVCPPPRRGRIRLAVLRAYASGAELAAFTRWRTCPFGQEFYEEGLVDPDGTVKDRFDEISKAIGEVRALTERLGPVKPANRAGILVDFDWIWTLDAPEIAQDVQFRDLLLSFIERFGRRALGVDIVGPDTDLQSYEILVMPFPTILNRALVEKLGVWVRGGGVLCATVLAGSRTPHNARESAPPPGLMAEMAGLEVRQLSPLVEEGVSVLTREGEPVGRAVRLAERVELKGATAVAVLRGGPFDGQPALCSHPAGQGRAFYLAAVPDDDLTDFVVSRLVAEVAPNVTGRECPPDVEILPAADSSGRPVTLVFNHTASPVEITLPEGNRTYKDVMTGKEFTGTATIDGIEVLVLV